MTEKFEILIVDDDPDIRDSLQIILEDSGYATRTAINGQQAKQELKQKRPDLMILDIMMGTDTEGFDLAFELKNHQEFEDFPIILLTSFLEKVRKEGPQDYQYILGQPWPAKWLFEKPVDSEKLLARLKDILE
jgi:DNA-binding response OmpR family regulator